MADLPEHKEGGDDGKPNTAVPLKNESSGLQCASLGVCGENPQPSKESTLLHSTSEKHQSGGVSLHPVEAKDAKSSEEASDHPVKLRVKDGSETNAFTKQDEMASSFDESKLAKTSVSQAKDPPDKEIAQGEENMLVIEQNESLPQESDSKEVLSVSTNSSETSVTLNNSTSAVCEAVRTGDVLKEFHTPTEAGTFSAVECQESKPTSLSTVKSPCLDTPSFAPRITPEKLIEPPADSQGSSKSSISFASLETSGIEGSSTQSSSMSSASDLCSASEIEPIVIDSPSHPSLLAPASKSFSAPTLSNSVQQESGNEMTLLVNQSLVNKAQCPQEYLCAESKSEDKVGGENAGAIIEEGKRDFECMVLDSSGNMTGQSEMRVKEKESCIDVDLTNETDSLTLPLIVATHSLSHLQDAEESTEKGEPTVLVSAEKKIVPSLESEPLRPVTIGSSLQPLELIQEVSVMESTPITTDMAIIESSADEADSIGGLVINNVIGAADGVVDFHPDDVETEKELTDISASTPQLVEGSDLSDEHGPSVKRRRLENGPNGVDDKSNSAKKVHFKVIPVKNGHGVWDSQKLQEVLISKGTILLQIHLSKESMELFQPDKDDRKIDFTAIMAETKDDDHDHVLSFGHVEPGDDPLSVAANPPSYERPFTPSHRGSTALQPAMSRPGFKHLQTPQQYLMKNEVLGLPPPLEFEDPQMGTPDWSDFGLNSKPINQQNTHLSFTSIPSQVPTLQQRVHTIKVAKVCKVCDVILDTPADIAKHQHCMLWKCGKCQFEAKTLESFNEHLKSHQVKYVQHKCNLCHEVFSSPITHAVHKRKIHGLFDCKYCNAELTSKTDWSNHIKLNHKDISKKPETNLSQSSNEVPSFTNKLLLPKYPILLPGSPAGFIITQDSMNTLAVADMNPSPVVFNPPLYTHGTPPLTFVTDQRISCKEESLKTENSTPETVLVKLKPKPPKKEKPVSKRVVLPCESCPAVFKNLTLLRIHIKQKHTERPRCPACNLTRSSSRKVFQHQVTAHKEKLRCRHYCLSLFDTREELSAHHIKVHNKDDTLMKCRYCRIDYTKGTYVEHLQKCQGEMSCKRVRTCSGCERRFVDITEYNHHIKLCEPSSAKDDSDGETPGTSTSAENRPIIDNQEEQNDTKHLATHQELENTQSEEEIVLDSEVVSNSPPKIGDHFKCRFCPKIFRREKKGVDHMINQHKRVFSYMKEYKVCDICGKLFISGLALCKHLVRHYENSDMLNKLFPENFSMEDIKGKCWICKTSGVSFSAFHTKARNSIIEKILSNEYCKTSMADKGYTFNCNLCKETFSEAHSFWTHIKIHLLKSPLSIADKGKLFSCSRCPRRYSIKSDLLKHFALHFIQKNINGDENEKINRGDTLADIDWKMDENLSEKESQDESDCTKLKSEVSDDNVETYECLHCQQVFNIKSVALKHVLGNHIDDLNEIMGGKVCHLCNKSFINSFTLCSHIIHHYIDFGMWEDLVPRDLLSRTNRHCCWICNNVFKINYSKHMTKRNDLIENALSNRSEALEDEQFQCPLCEYSCSNRYNHWKHIKLHLFLGRECLNYVQVNNSEVEQPTVSQDSQSKMFDCLKCSKQFDEISEFRRHLATHFLRPCKMKKRKRNENDNDNNKDSDNEPLAKKRKTMNLRSKSLRSSSGTIRCTSCFMTFKYANDAVSHVLRAHKFKMTYVNERALTCKLCGSKFKGQWWLCRHVANHYSNLEMWDALVPRDLANSLNSRNQCWICKSELDGNYVGHTSKRNAYIQTLLIENCNEEESRFDCSLCNKEFSRRTDYWQHMKLHLCDPPSKHNSQSELMTMEKNKEYECSDCSLYFENENALYKHLAFHFLEYTNMEKSTRSLVLEELAFQDSVQPKTSSDDEWLPQSKVNKNIEDDITSDNCQVKKDNRNVVNINEMECNDVIIKIEDVDSSNIDEM